MSGSFSWRPRAQLFAARKELSATGRENIGPSTHRRRRVGSPADVEAGFRRPRARPGTARRARRGGWSHSSSTPPKPTRSATSRRHDGAVVGWITSGGYGHCVGNTALGYVLASVMDTSSGFEVELRTPPATTRASLVRPRRGAHAPLVGGPCHRGTDALAHPGMRCQRRLASTGTSRRCCSIAV